MAPSDIPGLQPVLDRLMRDALADQSYEGVFAAFCEGVSGLGVPLLRTHLAMRALHPLVESVALTWHRDAGLDVAQYEHRSEPDDAWLRSPLYTMLTQERFRARHDLRDPDVVARYPLFAELRALGATDYLACLTPFGDPDTAFSRQAGVIISWATDAPGGFDGSDVELLEFVQPYVGVVAKLCQREQTARNVLSAYLGDAAGGRVLAGQIRLGDVERIPAVIWYSDMRDSTAMAERIAPEFFLEAVNDCFDCTAGAVLAHGGEVLRFIGDAVLAVFPVGAGEPVERAAGTALAAARDARHRLLSLNRRRREATRESLAFGLGLHLGELLFGNIGVASRVEFSVIGRAANEVARLESLTKEVGEPVLVSSAFRDALDLPWRDLGCHGVKGVGRGMQVFAPPEPF